MVSGGAFAQAVWAAFGPRPEAHARQLVRSRSTTLPAGAGSRCFSLLSALRAHTEAPYKTDFLWKTLRALNRPWAARTVGADALHAETRVRAVEHLQGGSRWVREGVIGREVCLS